MFKGIKNECREILFNVKKIKYLFELEVVNFI